MTDADNWPTFAEELGRKTSSELEKWTVAYEAEKITLREFYLIVSTLYDATSGLAPRDISNLLADVHQFLRVKAKRKKAA